MESFGEIRVMKTKDHEKNTLYLDKQYLKVDNDAGLIGTIF